MDRKVDATLLEWKEWKNHKALMVRGQRQTGKSYSIKQFGHTHYDTVIELNFEERPEFKKIFENDLSADSIYESIGFMTGMSPNGDTLLFLDEIQSCPGAISALKPLSADGRCDIICSGSMLSEIDKKRLTPIGYVSIISMFPMDFEEFLWAIGFTPKQTETIGTHIKNLIPFKPYVLNRLNDLFRKYIVIGGMPQSVLSYSESHDYAKSLEIQRDIIHLLRDDVSRYAETPMDKTRIHQCIESVPEQLSREKSNHFRYSDVSMSSGYGIREYAPAITWLEGAGIIDICRNLEEISEPFRTRCDGNTFKIYVRDTGLLTCIMGSTVAGGIVNGDFKINNGAIVENAVAESLIRKGYDVYYYSNLKQRMEIDFILNLNGKLTALEVKSGRKKSAKSLNKLMASEMKADIAMKISESNISTDENGTIHLPLFGPDFFDVCKPADIGQIGYIDELKSTLDGDDKI